VRRLGRALVSTLLTAGSLFALLLGVGGLLIGSADRSVWLPVVLIAVAGASCIGRSNLDAQDTDRQRPVPYRARLSAAWSRKADFGRRSI
jgi:hypothetical protein